MRSSTDMSQQQQQQQQGGGVAPPTKSGAERGTRSAFLARLPLFIRVAELCLTIIVLGLAIDPINARLQHNVNHSALTYVTFAGYLLINLVIIVTEVSGEPMPKTALLLFAFVGGVLFVAAGALLIHDWRTLFYTMHYHPPKMYMDMMITSGILAIFTSCLFFADVFITIRYALAEERAALREAAEAAADERGGGGGGGGAKRNSTGNDRQTDLADFAV